MAVERKLRNEMPVQDASERIKNFNEVALGYDLETAKIEASRCLNCPTAPCTKGCPVGVRIPEFLALVREGKIAEAGAVVKSTNSLPSVCGRVCPQESQCESRCVRAKLEGAVSIGSVERFVGDFMLNSEQAPQKAPSIGKRVAVVGSGPAGITCAAELVKSGVDVTVYEAFHRSGGVLSYGIPEFRLPKKLVQAEIDKLTEMGVKMQLNCVIGKTVTVDELLGQYDAVFIGSGAGLPIFMNIPGENLNGIFSANEYLTRINLMGAYKKDSATPVALGKRVAVIGAGNVAMDAARTALRMGADEVSVVYRRSREEMPARKAEIHHAEEEGVRFNLLVNPVCFEGENGRVTRIKCVRMQLTEPDASGRRKPVAIENSEFYLEVDTVIVALGTSPNPLIKASYDRLQTNERGIILVDEDMQTSVDGIYAGGDAVTGAATVILAMGAGRKAAAAILKRFSQPV